jgi:hypothetical protein
LENILDIDNFDVFLSKKTIYFRDPLDRVLYYFPKNLSSEKVFDFGVYVQQYSLSFSWKGFFSQNKKPAKMQFSQNFLLILRAQR